MEGITIPYANFWITRHVLECSQMPIHDLRLEATECN